MLTLTVLFHIGDTVRASTDSVVAESSAVQHHSDAEIRGHFGRDFDPPRLQAFQTLDTMDMVNMENPESGEKSIIKNTVHHLDVASNNEYVVADSLLVSNQSLDVGMNDESGGKSIIKNTVHHQDVASKTDSVVADSLLVSDQSLDVGKSILREGFTSFLSVIQPSR